MAVRNRDDDDDDRPRKKKPRPSEDIQDEDRPLKKRRPADDEDDDDDDRPRRRSVRRSSPDDGGVGIVIPYRNGMALMAYYFGIFGLILCFLGGVPGILGIVPITLGILGLKKASNDPDAHGSAHAWIGIALGALEVLTGCGAAGFFIFAGMKGR
jgi:hypothetical protein